MEVFSVLGVESEIYSKYLQQLSKIPEIFLLGFHFSVLHQKGCKPHKVHRSPRTEHGTLLADFTMTSESVTEQLLQLV